MISYKAENPKDLALKIKYLLSNKNLMKRLGENNKRLSQKFSWEHRVINSELLEIIKTYVSVKRITKAKISIIIKTFNEERHIERCIKSALMSLKGLKGEVILVDSKSYDKTVKLAKKYPIKIIKS